MNDVALRQLLRELKAQEAKQAPVFNDRTLVKIKRIENLLLGENEMKAGVTRQETYTFPELEIMRTSKAELFDPIPRGVDFALPQHWLNAFALWCTENKPEVTYNWILCTTCWDCNISRPLFKATEVKEAYEEMSSE